MIAVETKECMGWEGEAEHVRRISHQINSTATKGHVKTCTQHNTSYGKFSFTDLQQEAKLTGPMNRKNRQTHEFSN